MKKSSLKYREETSKISPLFSSPSESHTSTDNFICYVFSLRCGIKDSTRKTFSQKRMRLGSSLKRRRSKGKETKLGKNIVEILAFYSINGVFLRLGGRNKIFQFSFCFPGSKQMTFAISILLEIDIELFKLFEFVNYLQFFY